MPLFVRALPLWLAAALCLPARAGVVAGPAPVFAPVSGAWAAPLSAAFSDQSLQLTTLLPPGLAGTDFSKPNLVPRELAPLVAHMASGLDIKPEAFAALPAAQKKAAIELAVEAAHEDLRVKIYLLADRARQAASNKNMDKHGRAELYEAVAQLMEAREHYRGWFKNPESEEEPPELQALDEAYNLASAKAWETRQALLGEAEAPVSEKAQPPPASVAYVLQPSGYAQTLREQMKATKSGWGQDDLHALYTGYGFVLRQGGKHRFYSHPAFPQLHESVSRQNDLPPGYASSALKLIDELEKLSAPAAEGEIVVSGPPANLTLGDLSILLAQPKTKTPAPLKTVPVETKKSRAPPVAPVSVIEKTRPEPVVVLPAKTAQLEPATERVKEDKPGPPPAAKTDPGRGDLFDRLKAVWRRLNKKP